MVMKKIPYKINYVPDTIHQFSIPKGTKFKVRPEGIGLVLGDSLLAFPTPGEVLEFSDKETRNEGRKPDDPTLKFP